MLKPYLHKGRGSEYMRATFRANGRQVRKFVHVIVCEAWNGPAPIAQPLVCHNNGDPMDNRADNLRWGSHAENMADRERHEEARRIERTP